MLNEEIKIDVPLVLTPEQIYDYMHEEHTPYSSMSKEDSKAHICRLIQRYSDDQLQKYKNYIELP